MNLEKLFLTGIKAPRNITKAAGAYGALEGAEYIQSTSEGVQGWYDGLSTLQEAGVGTGTIMLGLFLANMLYNIPAKRINRLIGGPLL